MFAPSLVPLHASLPVDRSHAACTLKILLSNDQCGAIIGRGGVTVSALQDKFQVGIKFGSADNNFPGTPFRAVVIRGKVRCIRACLVEMVSLLWHDNLTRISAESMMLPDAATGAIRPREEFAFRILVPAPAAGAILGKNGYTVRTLTQSTQATIKLSQQHPTDTAVLERIITYSGSCAAVTAAVVYSFDILSSESRNLIYANPLPTYPKHPGGMAGAYPASYSPAAPMGYGGYASPVSMYGGVYPVTTAGLMGGGDFAASAALSPSSGVFPGPMGGEAGISPSSISGAYYSQTGIMAGASPADGLGGAGGAGGAAGYMHHMSMGPSGTPGVGSGATGYGGTSGYFGSSSNPSPSSATGSVGWSNADGYSQSPYPTLYATGTMGGGAGSTGPSMYKVPGMPGGYVSDGYATAYGYPTGGAESAGLSVYPEHYPPGGMVSGAMTVGGPSASTGYSASDAATGQMYSSDHGSLRIPPSHGMDFARYPNMMPSPAYSQTVTASGAPRGGSAGIGTGWETGGMSTATGTPAYPISAYGGEPAGSEFRMPAANSISTPAGSEGSSAATVAPHMVLRGGVSFSEEAGATAGMVTSASFVAGGSQGATSVATQSGSHASPSSTPSYSRIGPVAQGTAFVAPARSRPSSTPSSVGGSTEASNATASGGASGGVSHASSPALPSSMGASFATAHPTATQVQSNTYNVEGVPHEPVPFTPTNSSRNYDGSPIGIVHNPYGYPSPATAYPPGTAGPDSGEALVTATPPQVPHAPGMMSHAGPYGMGYAFGSTGAASGTAYQLPPGFQWKHTLSNSVDSYTSQSGPASSRERRSAISADMLSPYHQGTPQHARGMYENGGFADYTYNQGGHHSSILHDVSPTAAAGSMYGYNPAVPWVQGPQYTTATPLQYAPSSSMAAPHGSTGATYTKDVTDAGCAPHQPKPDVRSTATPQEAELHHQFGNLRLDNTTQLPPMPMYESTTSHPAATTPAAIQEYSGAGDASTPQHYVEAAETA